MAGFNKAAIKGCYVCFTRAYRVFFIGSDARVRFGGCLRFGDEWFRVYGFWIEGSCRI